jgi:phosphoglycerate dehydrogenase-like enzyme
LTISPAHNGSPVLVVLHSGEFGPNLEKRAGDAEIRFSTAAELRETLPGADVLLVWDFTIGEAVRESWPAADALRWVHTASAGVDKLIFGELVASEVVLTNSRGVFDTAMAEYVLALMLAFAKDLPRTVRLADRGEWRHRETETLAGATAVVVGGGPIGAAIARLLGAVGVRVERVGRRARPGVHAADDLPGLLPHADYLVLAAPLTEQTRGMVNADTLRPLAPTARLVNVGRGALVVQDDVVAALRAGRLAGAALDVFESEPLPPDSPLWTTPGMIVSPHMSGDAVGWRDALVELFVDNLERYRAGQPLRNVVDKTAGYVTAPRADSEGASQLARSGLSAEASNRTGSG